MPRHNRKIRDYVAASSVHIQHDAIVAKGNGINMLATEGSHTRAVEDGVANPCALRLTATACQYIWPSR